MASIKRVMAMMSGTGSLVRALLKHQVKLETEGNCPFDVVLMYTDKPSSNCASIAGEYKIEMKDLLDLKDYCKVNETPYKTLCREERDQKLVELVSNYEIDVVYMGGYLKIVTPIFIRAFGAILNSHPAPTDLLGDDGLPKYAGLHVVKRQLEDRADVLCSTIHFVNEGVDTGRPVVFTDGIDNPYIGAEDPGQYEDEIQDLLKKQEQELFPKVIEQYCRGEL